MIKMGLINLMHCYLLSNNKKIKSARLLYKLNTDLLQSVLQTKVIDKEELNSWVD